MGLFNVGPSVMHSTSMHNENSDADDDFDDGDNVVKKNSVQIAAQGDEDVTERVTVPVTIILDPHKNIRISSTFQHHIFIITTVSHNTTIQFWSQSVYLSHSRDRSFDYQQS